jgi:hypothetical protein
MDHSMELQPGPLGSIEGTASSPGPHGSLDGTPTGSPGIHGCASSPGPERQPVPARRGLHHAGPVGVDHSMELQPGPLGSIEGTASRVPAPMDHSMELQPGPLGSMVVHRVPARSSNQSRPAGDCIMLARSALIGLPTCADVHPWFADVCRRVQTFIHGLPTCASCWPPWITRWNCIESRPMDHSMELQPGPLGSMVVHTSGPGIHGCASCWPWDPWLCILLALGSIVVHHAGPGIHGCASCWPGRR